MVYTRYLASTVGPGRGFGLAAIESCTRAMARDNEVTIRWVPSHHGVVGNEKADEFTRAAAERNRPDSAVPDELRWGTSLSHMTRVATEAQARRTRQWIEERLGDPRKKYSPPSGRGVRRRLLRRALKYIAGRYYQLLSSHPAIGPYLKDKIHKADDDRCWWCGEGPTTTSLRSAGLGSPRLGGCGKI